MSILDMLYDKIRNSLNSKVSERAVVRIVDECAYRTQWLGMNISELLDDDVAVSLNLETGEIDIRQDRLFGIFWSFDSETGDLVGT